MKMIYIKRENKSGKLTGSLPGKMMKDKKQGVEVPFQERKFNYV